MRQIGMRLRHFARDDAAATMVEYAIMLVLIAAVSIAIVAVIGRQVKGEFELLNGLF